MRATRRTFLLSASSLALAAPVLGVGLDRPASAESYPLEELLKPGPLGDQILGADNAPVTVIEYASVTCSHCAHFAETTFPQLKAKYIDTGKMRYIFREFPYDPVAAGAFMLARCAPKDKFFPMIELLFKTMNQWAVERPLAPLLAVAKQAGFTEDSFKACLANQQVLDGIEWARDRAANKFKVESTPTFFVNGQKLSGAMSIDAFDKVIEPYLKS